MLSKLLKYELKARAHALKPVVLMGAKGLTPEVLAEIDHALLANELIKIKLTGVERADKQAVLDAITQATSADCVQLLGHVATLYRENPDLLLPKPKPVVKKPAKLPGRSRRS
jgi:RNA-binding protein